MAVPGPRCRFFQQGSQPAEALPSTTIAYASIDLDPSGSQKIDAFRTLNKFPAFKDQVGIHSVDDVRKKLGDELIKGLGCDGLTFDDDIDPWLGDRAAVARGRHRRREARLPSRWSRSRTTARPRTR